MSSRQTLTVATLALVSLACAATCFFSSHTRFERASARPSVTVDCSLLPTDLPHEWLAAPTNLKTTAISEIDCVRLRRIADQELKKTALSGLWAQCHRIVLLGTIHAMDIDVGGTSTESVIVLAARETNGTVRAADRVARTIYHEIAGLLFIRGWNPSMEAEWRSCNPDGFSYGDGGVEAVKRQQYGKEPHELLLEQGFVCQFGIASVRDDFVAFAEVVFAMPGDAAAFCQEYPRVRAKVSLLRKFYRRVDPELDKWFEAILLSAA